MVRRRVRSLVAGFGAAYLAIGVGCRLISPDPRDFTITDLPPVPADARSSAVVQTSGAPSKEPVKQPAAPLPPKAGSLNIPPDLPGADAPPVGATEGGKDRFPALPPLAEPPPPAPSPTGQPLTLAELEQTALRNNPTVRQAAATVEVQRGQAIQAGLYPNPAFGYQADQIGTGEGVARRGQPGVYFEFILKAPGKLALARLVQLMDYYNAQIALKKAQMDLVNQVRSNYFAVLVAREAITVNRALARFTEDLYKAQQGLVKGAEQAPYEPLQSYVLALQARAVLLQARNRYAAAWRQLAASLGQPELPATELAGRADAPVPAFDIDKLREQVLANHTDVLTAENSVLQARYNLRLAEITPVPDLSTHIYLEKDWTTPPYRTQVGVQTGGPIPVFDRNQGNRLAAKAQLARAIDDVPRARNDLASRLAVAFEAYENNRVLVGYYRDQMIPNQVRVYRAVYQRYQVAPPGEVTYTDVVTAQGNLGASLANYLTALTALWSSVVDLATLAQSEELYLPGPGPEGGALDQLLHQLGCPPAVAPPPQPGPVGPVWKSASKPEANPAPTSLPAPAPGPETPAPRPVPPAAPPTVSIDPPRP
jgi:cobalt-zinc-cadmium efflux system outer membrane protein